jgi:putative peptidoglycan lipid II flippase
MFTLRGFYAHKDTRTPFVVNVVENAVNILLAVLLVGRYGVLGLGAAFALAYAVSALWSLQILAWKVPGFPLRRIFASLWRIVVAAALMGELVWVVARQVGGNTGRDALLRLVVGSVVGVVVYVVLLVAMRAPELAAAGRWWQGRGRAPVPADAPAAQVPRPPSTAGVPGSAESGNQ